MIESCVGCGLCGEVSHAAILCPSFYRAEIVYNPTKWERTLASIRQKMIRPFLTKEAIRLAPPMVAQVMEPEEAAKAA